MMAEPGPGPFEMRSILTAEIPFADSGVDAPVVYADVIRGTTVMGEVTKINLIDHRVDLKTNVLMAKQVAILVIPTSQLRAWGKYLTSVADSAGLPVLDEQ